MNEQQQDDGAAKHEEMSQPGASVASFRSGKAAILLQQAEEEFRLERKRLQLKYERDLCEINLERQFLKKKQELAELAQEESRHGSIGKESRHGSIGKGSAHMLVDEWFREPGSAEVSEEIRRMRAQLATRREAETLPPPAATPSISSNKHAHARVEKWLRQTEAEEAREGIPRNEKCDAATEPSLGPTKAQAAARKMMARELPKFNGRPEEWPIFHSAYTNSTKECGYTLAENLARLQRCLGGPALEAVSGRLLLPATVPSVMATLEKLFGRPEILLNVLLAKIKRVPPPQVENITSIITYGLAVQNLTEHMIAANQTQHMQNPMLIQELTSKLPTTMKMQWAEYKQNHQEVTVDTLNQFLAKHVELASEFYGLEKQSRQERPKSNEKVHAHVDRSDKSKITKRCFHCGEANHYIAGCDGFKALDVTGRWKLVKQKELCRICLVPHSNWPCRSFRKCSVEDCRKNHHPLLHEATEAKEKEKETANPQLHHSATTKTNFRYVKVTLTNRGKSCTTFAFLDDGSSTTLLEEKIADKLGLVGINDPLHLAWTNNVTRMEEGSRRVSVEIQGQGQHRSYQMKNVRTVNDLELPVQSMNYNQLAAQFPHLAGLPIQSYEDAKPGLLIGLEHAHLLASLKTRVGRNQAPIADKTRLGWCIYGKHDTMERSEERLNLHRELDLSNQGLHDRMREFFNLEDACITVKLQSENDKRAYDILQNTTKRVGKAFETGLLWKCDNIRLPDSKMMAEKRWYALEKKLYQNPTLKDALKVQMMDYLQQGYAHRLSESEEREQRYPVWYLPLGVVVNAKKSGKVRMVWDAAARSEGMSLNDALMKGPDLLVPLIQVLVRFRQRSFAICGDIRQMFHQIKIREADRQAQRFLWREDADMSLDTFVLDVATFGATCSPTSAQYVKNVNAQEFKKSYPKAAEAIISNHYVDDYLDSFDSVEEAVQTWREVKRVHAEGGFEIRHLTSNSLEVLRSEGEGEHVDAKSMQLEAVEGERVLGMVWLPKEDAFTFTATVSDIDTVSHPSKRQVLRVVMSLFDPLGLIAHFVIRGKILMQHIWRSGVDWDEPIPEDLLSKWHEWSDQLKELNVVRVPRCLLGDSSSTSTGLQLHVFVDAGEEAYACVAFLRVMDAGVPRCSLVAAKTKVAPLKPLSIPRLELQAALIGSRMADYLTKTMTIDIQERFMWSDSATVLAWLRSDSRRYHQFVAFRVGEILSLTTVNEWNHVPSKLNVADDATKWRSSPSLAPENRWYQGPSFLYSNQEMWPQQSKENVTVEEELRPERLHLHTERSQIIDVTRFSTWERKLKTMASVLRAISRMRKNKIVGRLTTEEMQKAETVLFRLAQKEEFAMEYELLKSKGEGVPKQSRIYGLSPYLDECSVIRMNSRLQANAEGLTSFKSPIILPKGNGVTNLLIDYYHRRFLHGNNETVLNEMRQKFRIPSMRTAIRSVARNCQRCRNARASPESPQMAQLPPERLTTHVRAFTHTGVDYFGPLKVKRGRSLVKRWVALFTCLTVRAVHLEVVHTLEVTSCVMAIRRFIARRGAPKTIWSDNGTNFVGANNVLRTQLKDIDERCAGTFTSTYTTWRFNPPGAPHMGGAWERLVRSVKGGLAVIADYSTHPDDETLETVLLEVESVVNSRPLTYVPLEFPEQEALTPNHFLLYGLEGVQQPPLAPGQALGTLRDSWNLAQNLVDSFWHRWIREYLPVIARRTKWYQRTKPIEVGDVVIVIEDRMRNGWARGIVQAVTKSRDGQVRRARVRVGKVELDRPATKLAVLDVTANP